MTLDEFLVELRKSADGFEKLWRKKNEEDPDNWPIELPAGDWSEQFLAHEYGMTE
ncbi:MAG: hypothetical protein K5863_08780 [Nitratireductor sp.]|uniref:hypothetical protein n=1 Tax=Nitratireductor sp. TaxID=1872084 RepID=UPI00262B3F71|nr:hypothetical protein [Nitratireductor sp.]MCV0350157.1 hypothetical protein [Nitratireductor sp.]